MIILEGADNSGKSTLGKKLAKKFHLPLVHSSRPKGNLLPLEILSHSNNQLKPSKTIQDRVYAISEYVYGHVIRGKTDLGAHHAIALEDLYSRDHLIIYCRPNLKTILKNVGREQMEGVIDNHPELVNEYDELMVDIGRYSNNKVVRYDYELDPINYVYERVADHLSKLYSQESSIHFLTRIKHA